MNKIANVQDLFFSVETLSRRPKLCHYTKPTNFESINAPFWSGV